jgi:3-hydroxybutyrate dehydrogenase
VKEGEGRSRKGAPSTDLTAYHFDHPVRPQAAGTTENFSMVKGKVAVVTGSTSGIGLAIAAALSKAGAHVVLNGLGDKSVIAAAKAKVRRRGVKVAYHAADMTKPAEIADLVDFAVREFGSVDILVNNAGIQHTSLIENFPVEQWDRVIAINQSAVFHATRAALPHMKKRKFGRIINIASVHGLVSSVEKVAYCAAKHAVIGITEVTALEGAKDGIRCNAICPGWVLTPLVQAQIEKRAKDQKIKVDQAQRELLSEKQPTEEFVKVEHLADAVLFLCSEAGSNMTGVPLIMDGGWTAR